MNIQLIAENDSSDGEGEIVGVAKEEEEMPAGKAEERESNGVDGALRIETCGSHNGEFES